VEGREVEGIDLARCRRVWVGRVLLDSRRLELIAIVVGRREMLSVVDGKGI
jgi:hypothetical protein